ncbi:MAG: lipoate--protein ligase [Clostridia bacterium]|nr:lipoate--protein ligase [Clostridia bacterium]
MFYIANNSHDPHYNLAFEEYVFHNLSFDEPCLLLWQNEPSVIVGRFQNTLEEINQEYIKQHHVHVVRRITGGGAVYHDLGNLNYTFIAKHQEKVLDFRKFTEPVIKALREMGVPAKYSGRNDLTINGKKFSGNSQYNFRGKTMHHGTLLFASNLDAVQAALNVKSDKFQSKGVKSVRSRVTNISEYLPKPISIQEFKSLLLTHIFQGEAVREYQLADKDYEQIERLKTKKYLTWSWNYGHSPAFNFKNSQRFPCGKIEICLQITSGIIKECKFYGDFFSNENIEKLEQKFVGIKYQEEELAAIIKAEDIEKYFGQVSREELLLLFFP